MQTEYTRVPQMSDNKKPHKRRSGSEPAVEHRANDLIQPIHSIQSMIQLNASNTTRNSTLTALYTAR